MWKNKSGWKGSFTNQRQRGQFGREDQQHGKDNRRGNTKWAGHEYSRQNDRSYFQESSKNFRLDQDRYGESAVHVAVEIEGGAFNRESYEDLPFNASGVQEEFDNTYREDINDRRNVEPSFKHYDGIGDRSSDNYWNDRQTLEIDEYNYHGQEFREDDQYGRGDQMHFGNSNLDRYDREFESNLKKHDREFLYERASDRNEDHHERYGRYRDRGIHYDADTERNLHGNSANFGKDERSYDRRVSRHSWNDNEKRNLFANRSEKDHKQKNKSIHGERFQRKSFNSKNLTEDKIPSSKNHESSKTSCRDDKRKKEHAYGCASKAKADTRSNRIESRRSSGYKSRSDPRHTQKPEQKEERKSVDRDKQTLDKSDKKPSDNRTATMKHDSELKREQRKSDKNDSKNQSCKSYRDESGNFKKPLEKQHQHRQRSNSARKLESDSGNVKDDDILSIMADDDGFEREMRIDVQTVANRSALSGGSRERDSQVIDSGRQSSRDREPFDKHQHDRDNSSKQNSAEYISNTSQVMDFRGSSRRNAKRENRQLAFNNRFRKFGTKNFRQSGRNNNYIGGRSRLSVASKIKDSYFKKRQTYQTLGYRGYSKRQSSSPVHVHKQTHFLQQKHVKNEIGKTGAILKEDRMIENRRDKSRSADKRVKGNDSDRSSRLLSYKQNFSRNSSKNRFQRDKAPIKSKGLAYHKVKKKYLKGGFTGNKPQTHIDRRGKYDREEKRNDSQRSKRSEVSNPLDEEGLPQNDQELDDQSLDPSEQQVIFIPNADLQTGQSHIIDQFGQIIVNPEDAQQIETQVPIQYLPQQFHPDGEQMVFIPFVNNQTQPSYSENIQMLNNDKISYTTGDTEISEETLGQNTTDTKVVFQGKRPLSKNARAKIRKHIALKRKQRLEKAIEQKVLKKLLSNPSISMAIKENTLDDAKKKPLIKRISPPGAFQSSHNDKKSKNLKKSKSKDEFEDVSEDENKYDHVSDLEDISEFEDISDENDDFESRRLKRPVFRKPGQPRIRKSIGDSSGDVRKVIDQRSVQEDHRYAPGHLNYPSTSKKVDVKQKGHQVDDNQRSVYIENSGKNRFSLIGQKRESNVNKNEIVTKKRPISPIEITVSNDHYSKKSSENPRYKNDFETEIYRSSSWHEENKADSMKRDSERRNDMKRVSERRNDRTRNRKDQHEKVFVEKKYDDKERKERGHDEKYSNTSNINIQAERGGQKYPRNKRNYHTGNYTEDQNEFRQSGSANREQRNAGKYETKQNDFSQEGKDSDGQRKDRSYNRKDDVSDKYERRSLTCDEKRHSEDQRRDIRYSNRKRDDGRSQDFEGDFEEFEPIRIGIKHKSRDNNEESCRNEGKGRYKNATESVNETGNKLQVRHRNNFQEDGTNKNIPSNSFASTMNQGHFQVNQPLMQQSFQPQTFMTTHSQSLPLQFSNSNNIIDHSLPPVQNAPMSMPPMPPPGVGVRPDMSLPPPIMNVVGTPTSMVIQQPDNVQFQQHPMQQVSMQQQTMQQQQFQNMHSQFQKQQQQQQQFHQMQQQPQLMQQQHSGQQFQSQHPVYQRNIQSDQQMSLQHSGQFQHNQNVGMVPVSQNIMQSRVSQQRQGDRQGLGTGQQVIQTSMNQPSYIATTPQQAVRGVIGRVRIAGPMDQVSISPTVSRRPGAGHSRTVSSDYQDEEDEDDLLAEMLCSKCDKVFLSHEVMRRHGRWHDMIESNSKTWRCDQCEQGFTSLSGHTEHMSSKHSRDSWNCSLCDMTFSNSSGLNKHVRHTSHKDLKVKFICSLCPASFMVLMHLVQHKKENHQSNVGYSELRKY